MSLIVASQLRLGKIKLTNCPWRLFVHFSFSKVEEVRWHKINEGLAVFAAGLRSISESAYLKVTRYTLKDVKSCSIIRSFDDLKDQSEFNEHIWAETCAVSSY